jgi:glycosyltransferase involved in cell wall biosynthesis
VFEPRKILFYTHALTGGGAERAWSLLASGFARHGDRVIFAVDYDSNENKAYLDPAVRVETLGGGHWTNISRLTRLISHERPDAILSALGISNLKLFIAALLSGRRRRAILSYHGFFGSEPQMLSRLAYALTPLTTRLTAATVAVSDTLRDDLISTWHAAPHRVRRIYNPVVWGEGGCFPRRDRDQGPPLVLASGRLIAPKNFRALVRAFAEVEPKTTRLVIIGEGPEREAIAAEIARLGLGERVSLPGYVAAPWDLYAHADCFVVSSRIESFGMVVVEALAHGLPVVSTDCRGPREILANGRFGRLVPKDDLRAMADAITAALADPGPAAARIARAACFRPHLSLDLYDDLLADVVTEAERPARATGSYGL